ncbi:hypothetical protein A2643_00095 [Candidatus Nomurabacteria bacterium RIFCSPHIGHO2_01_FULL_39_220]|uniref:Uncharacterized protein n=1 Tax=Candidatus Nomurabacteria bacterium RIFCSPLOWO2_02_FULL_40_67 TaxID=1801787 RepID=A0A1F6Y2I6_9BACT|nr:MAG: hypothetical protein UU01_C0021G0012 [Parcubacteria group bacterium GW2011_GWA2_40_37]OGI62387.1 MAG: hypothetical protein A2W12_03255 [Candidatus Nomurabacteria bacterium RBG_16_40_11]OGI70928.1 MAG: hypothetical protein A2643_00095 [Candidatus Nomurabacteria bacterium RIFCSPHIGHO2_01_FULL_39_220]OGI72359.1 MAG: hypothetical protein A2W56_02490 [Candidatus Nomurabacteria bacterium RIFCSPHIGHO2_02_41_18]OGI78939.1 MAG: hypothetical protein A3C65_00110 [Candidatus Nomurabacteria bacteriu
MTKIVSLKQFNIERPEKILYDLPISNETDLYNNIKGKRLKSFLHKSEEILKKNNIEWKYEELTEKKFLEWLPYYKEKMNELNHNIWATEKWYQEETQKGYNIKALFFYQNGKIVGSGIMAFKDNLVSLAFKATDRITVSHVSYGSLGSIIDFLRLKLICKEGNSKTVVTRSRNAFGVINSIDYLDFRLRFGYTIRPNLSAPILSDVPVNDDDFVLFYGLQNGELSLYALQSKEASNKEEFFNKKSFFSSEIPFKKIYY